MKRLLKAALAAAHPAILRILQTVLVALVLHLVGAPEVLVRILVAYIAFVAWMRWGLMFGLPYIPIKPGETSEEFCRRLTIPQTDLVVALGIARSGLVVVGVAALAWLVF